MTRAEFQANVTPPHVSPSVIAVVLPIHNVFPLSRRVSVADTGRRTDHPHPVHFRQLLLQSSFRFLHFHEEHHKNCRSARNRNVQVCDTM